MQKPNKISASQKTSIVNEWRSVFPELSRYKTTLMLSRKGYVLTGIELFWGMTNENYQPNYVLYTLLPERHGKDVLNSVMYQLRGEGLSIYLPIAQASLSHLADDTEQIKKIIDSQCIIPFDANPSNKQIAAALLAECERSDSRIYHNKMGIYQTLMLLAWSLKNEDADYSQYLLNYALTYIWSMKTDYISRTSMEQSYKMTFDEIVEYYKSLHINSGYADLIAEAERRLSK